MPSPWGTFISNTMMVMMMAITPSLNASSRFFLIQNALQMTTNAKIALIIDEVVMRLRCRLWGRPEAEERHKSRDTLTVSVVCRSTEFLPQESFFKTRLDTKKYHDE